MNIRKSSKAKHYKNKTANVSPHKQLLTIINQTSIRDEYIELVEFAVKINLQKSQENGIHLTETAQETLENAATRYVLAAQLRNINPSEVKRKITESAKNSRSHANWKADMSLERKYNIMAGLAVK
ncbi:hypothetical protein [Proteus columbae]|uniref:hypothetical protein n=1 Tax=Proteus columbae TaxID=1987580 RepID=UPI000C1E3BAA|nr:hypothetical protein [Proteus columbae]